MALVEFGAGISALRGSIGGWTFHKNRAGNIVRLRGGTPKRTTSKQDVAIGNHVSILSDWQEITPAEKSSWDAFANAHTKEDMFGDVRTLTGQNWFETVNLNRELVGNPRISSPPSFALPIGNTNFSLVVDETQIEITKAAPLSPPDTGLIIRTTPPLTRSTTSLRSSLRLTDVLINAPFNPFNIANQWSFVHGCPWPTSAGNADFTIGVMLQLINKSSGITSAGNTLLGDLIVDPQGIGFWAIEVDFVVS